MDDQTWLNRRAETLFDLNASGQILRGRDPKAPAPKVFLQRSAKALTLHLRHDLDHHLAGAITNLARLEPPDIPFAALQTWDKLTQLLGTNTIVGGGPVYDLPHGTSFPTNAELISSDTPQGDQRLSDWRRIGLPDALTDLGFTDSEDVWRPWCLALEGDEVVALCQTARHQNGGAEAGVITVPTHRGQGLAAAVTACWSAHPKLAHVTLYYSTWNSNLASQRVAAKLGLLHRAQDFKLT